MCVNIISLFIGIIGSVIASPIFIFCQFQWTNYRNKKKFSSYIGDYNHLQLNQILISSTISTFTFEQPNIINMITVAQEVENNFNARIFMSESNPEMGEGSYEYTNRDIPEWGRIQIQRNHLKTLLYVKSVSNRSDIQDVDYLMRKII